MLLRYFILVFLLFPFFLKGQSINTVHNRVTINFQDHFVYAYIKTDNAKPRARNKVNYYWFSANDIKKTRGGYEGRLLHGGYVEFYSNKDLKVKGKFKNGFKKGKWKYWYPNGQYQEVIKWRRKGKVGRFKSYNENGQVIRKGKYKFEYYDGIFKEWNGQKLEKKKYKKGNLVIKEKRAKVKEDSASSNLMWRMIKKLNLKKNSDTTGVLIDKKNLNSRSGFKKSTSEKRENSKRSERAKKQSTDTDLQSEEKVNKNNSNKSNQKEKKEKAIKSKRKKDGADK